MKNLTLVAFGGGSTCSLESFAVKCFKQVSGEQVGEQKRRNDTATNLGQSSAIFHHAGKSQRANQSTFALLVAKKKISHITCSPPSPTAKTRETKSNENFQTAVCNHQVKK
jgi:hypothetical protein